MKISSNDLINLPVYTQSGKHLGKVASFEIDTDAGKLENFHVKTGLIEGLWHEQLIINSNQVIEITAEKMIVKDGINKEKVTDFNLAPAAK